MVHPDSELRWVNDAIGFGVFATRRIPRGTIVWALDDLDQRLTPQRVRQLGRRYQSLLERYSYVSARGDRVLCWDHARWINHSCDANVLSTGWEFDMAVRDIEGGEEITNDYGALNLEQSFHCCCGRPVCRGVVGPEDFAALAPAWDARVREAFPDVRRVPQPLWSWLSHKREVTLASRHPEALPSVARHRYTAPTAEPAARRAGAPQS